MKGPGHLMGHQYKEQDRAGIFAFERHHSLALCIPSLVAMAFVSSYYLHPENVMNKCITFWVESLKPISGPPKTYFPIFSFKDRKFLAHAGSTHPD